MCVTHELQFVVRKIGATIPVALIAHHTPNVASFGRTSWIYMEKPFDLKVHLSTELKSRFSAEQKECGVSFFVMYSLKVPVYIIQSCFTICVTEIVNYSCLVWSKCCLSFLTV